MKTGIRPADVGAIVDPKDPTKWVAQLPQLSAYSIDEMVDRYFMVDGNGVMLNVSTIPDAGLGVVIMNDAPQGTVLTKYEGALVSMNTLQEIRAEIAKKPEQLEWISSHTIVLNFAWVTLANFVVDEPLPRVAGGDAFTSRGLYYVNNPLRTMRGKGLGGYINTLIDDPKAGKNDFKHTRNGFNVRFEIIEDSSLTSLKKDRLKHFKTRWMGQPQNFVMAAVALRDLTKGEELFVDYNRLTGTALESIKSSASIPEAHMEISWVRLDDEPT